MAIHVHIVSWAPAEIFEGGGGKPKKGNPIRAPMHSTYYDVRVNHVHCNVPCGCV